MPLPRVFFPQASLDQWIVLGTIELAGNSLTLNHWGRRFEVCEGVYVKAEVTGAGDPHELIGKVKPKAELEAKGAEILESSMVFGDHAYDIVPGWFGSPTIAFPEYAQSSERAASPSAAEPPPSSDEAILSELARG